MFALNRKRIECSGQFDVDFSTGKIPKTVFMLLFVRHVCFARIARESFIEHMINYRNADEVVRTITDIHEYYPRIRRRGYANKVTSDTFDCSLWVSIKRRVNNRTNTIPNHLFLFLTWNTRGNNPNRNYSWHWYYLPVVNGDGTFTNASSHNTCLAIHVDNLWKFHWAIGAFSRHPGKLCCWWKFDF